MKLLTKTGKDFNKATTETPDTTGDRQVLCYRCKKPYGKGHSCFELLFKPKLAWIK